jgi:hypothetical protein
MIIDMGSSSFDFKEIKALTPTYFCKYGNLIEIDNGVPSFENKE